MYDMSLQMWKSVARNIEQALGEKSRYKNKITNLRIEF